MPRLAYPLAPLARDGHANAYPCGLTLELWVPGSFGFPQAANQLPLVCWLMTSAPFLNNFSLSH